MLLFFYYFTLTYACQLRRGRKALLQAMISGVKTNIQNWYTFNPALPVKKENRGFRHNDCGRLLCPIDLDWDDER